MSTTGWRKVFKFTAIQLLKTKAFIISTVLIGIIIIALTASVNVLPTLFSNSSSENNASSTFSFSFKKVYILDETNVTTTENFGPVLEKIGLEVINVEKTDLDSVRNTVTNSTDSILVSISREEKTGVLIYAERPDAKTITQSDVKNLTAILQQAYSNMRNSIVGLDEKNAIIVSEPVYTINSIIGSEPVSDTVTMIKSVIPQVVSMILFFMIFVYGINVAQSIAQEKTSKVMELLLTSVRPLAIIIGKILAMGVISFAQFLMFGLLGIGSFLATIPFAKTSEISADVVSSAVSLIGNGGNFVSDLGKALQGVTPINILVIVIVFIIGFLFFALIAGLIGAGISRVEDLSTGMQPYSLVGVLGFYLAFFSASIGVISDTLTTMENIALYLPISSPFAIPSLLLTGRITTVQAIIPILFLVICVILMAMFVANIYEQVILHNGNRLKIKDMLGLIKKH